MSSETQTTSDDGDLRDIHLQSVILDLLENLIQGHIRARYPTSVGMCLSGFRCVCEGTYADKSYTQLELQGAVILDQDGAQSDIRFGLQFTVQGEGELCRSVQ